MALLEDIKESVFSFQVAFSCSIIKCRMYSLYNIYVKIRHFYNLINN